MCNWRLENLIPSTQNSNNLLAIVDTYSQITIWILRTRSNMTTAFPFADIKGRRRKNWKTGSASFTIPVPRVPSRCSNGRVKYGLGGNWWGNKWLEGLEGALMVPCYHLSSTRVPSSPFKVHSILIKYSEAAIWREMIIIIKNHFQANRSNYTRLEISSQLSLGFQFQ